LRRGPRWRANKGGDVQCEKALDDVIEDERGRRERRHRHEELPLLQYWHQRKRPEVKEGRRGKEGSRVKWNDNMNMKIAEHILKRNERR